MDNSFDAYTIAFGIRNTTHIDKVSGYESVVQVLMGTSFRKVAYVVQECVLEV